ncbi:MAG: hypothetical protein ABI472_14315 [Ginsengibacter sp.]
MLNKVEPAPTVAYGITKDEGMQVSQHISKPNVSYAIENKSQCIFLSSIRNVF